jgi:tetratricopeptide (TPR) repeat protein
MTMDSSGCFKRRETRGRRTTWIIMLASSSISHTVAQSVARSDPVTAACVDLNQTALTHVANGKLNEAELAVSAVLASGRDHAQDACAGLVLHNMAGIMAVSGRLADAERLAERAVLILEKTYSPTDPTLLRPLHMLAVARFEQGDTARTREAFKRMQAIRIQRPEDSALVHGTAATLLEVEGRLLEAETEYLASIRAWEEAGRSESADMGAVLNDLGSLYIHEQRLSEARQALDRAFAIFSRAPDAAPMDRIKLLAVRGVLQARQGVWQAAEQDLRDALSMADREPWVDPLALRFLLTNYAAVLRRNHHGREARPIEARAAAIQIDRTRAALVDITDLLPKTKSTKK